MNKVSKIVVVALLIIAICFSGSYVYLTHKINTLKNEKYLEVSRDMKKELQSLIKEKSEAILLVALGLSANQNIKNAIKKKRYDTLGFDELLDKLKHNTSLQNVWFHVIKTNGKSFYRSWTNKKGDNVLCARQDVVKMIQKPEIISKISTGKYDISFKAMVPIFDNGKFIGIVETIAKFYSIAKKMQHVNNDDLLIVVDKRYKKQLTRAFSKTFVGDYYIANPVGNDKFLSIVKNASLQKYLTIKNYMIDTKNSLLVTTFTLADINGKPMAYFILAKSLNQIDFSDIKQVRKNILEMTLVIVLLLIILFYYIYTIKYKHFIQQQNEKLEAMVEEKTKELQAKTDALTFVAHHDSLTKLPNKVLFLETIKKSIQQAKKTNEQLSVFFLDLDRFKEVNDTYGYMIGDTLLMQIKARLQECIGVDDTLARLSGDEFAILHKHATQASTVKLTQAILSTMKNIFYVKHIEILRTFSIGIALYPDNSMHASQLLRKAETAMYKAKDNGKNTYQFYDKHMTELALQKIQLDADIRKALKNEEFVAYFQPKIDARNGRVVGLETLIRWVHPEKGMIFPDAFIPFCEETGLVMEIDKYMLIRSMKQMMQWHKEGLKFGKVSVNVSTKKIESSNYIDELSYIIESLQFDTSNLELEILEGQIMKDPKKSIDILNKLRDLGISISVDDFGTGYSSLSYLKKLPINKIKIDRSFVIDVPADKDDVAMVKTIISLARNLDLEIIAEGVETKEQLDFLVGEGCYNIQGYYFSRPLPADECKAFIIANSKGK